MTKTAAVILGCVVLGVVVLMIASFRSKSDFQPQLANDTTATELPLSKRITTQSDFEHSEFCRQYRCKEKEHRPFGVGGQEHIYETSLTAVGLDLQTNTNPNRVVTGFGLMFYGRERLSDEDFNAINTLARSVDETAKHDKTTLFIRHNVEDTVCPDCQVDQSAKSTRDGNFRIWAGKSGQEQIVIFKVISSDEEAKYSQLVTMSDAALLDGADSLLAGTFSQISVEREGEAALYVSEFYRRHPSSSNKHAQQIGKRVAAVRHARDQAAMDAQIDRKSTRNEADDMCRVTLKEHLKAPSSADFQSFVDDYIEYMGNGKFRIRTKADAVNSFGAKLRSTFYCEVQCNTEENCTVTKIDEM